MEIGDRFKLVRSLADEPLKKCSQLDFGKMFHVSRDVIANIENGRVEPSAILMENICNKFNISYDWLAHGLEPMHVERSREEELSERAGQILSGDDNFRKAVVKMILSRTDEELDALKSALREIYDNLQ